MSAEILVADLQWVEIALSRLLSTYVSSKYMIDVGAHHGTSLEPFLRAGWNVVAFEPIEANRRQLANSFSTAENLIIRPEAVSNQSGIKAFHLALNLDGSLHEYHHSLENISEDAWHKKGPTVDVATVSLDALLCQGEIPQRIGFLKIDTEGHDLAVLEGASRLECDVISVEFWGDSHALGKSPSPAGDMIELLRSRGFDAYIALCHDGDATTAFYSSLQGVRADSWGNIVFFRNSPGNLFTQIVKHPDWLLILEMSDECSQLCTQLQQKEAVIQQLEAARQHLDANLAEVHAAATERLHLIERLDHELHRASHSWQKGILKRIIRFLPSFSHRNNAA